MKPSHQTMIHFYQHLGKLFFRVASVDKTVRKEEIEQLKDLTMLAHENMQAAQLRLDAVRFVITS